MSEGDNRITVYYKEDKLKIISDINMGTSTVIIDKKNKKTINLLDVMGMKTGFYTSAETQKQIQWLVDSMKKKPFTSLINNRKDTSKTIRFDSLNVNCEYVDENKIIAGYNCKKALMKTRHYDGTIDSMYVWYCPEFKFKPGFNIPTGMAGAIGLSGLELINGFPMKYETTNFNGDKVSVEVKKIDITKEIKDKEFDVPAGYDLKPINNFKATYQTKIVR
jgi:outer membrane lipoprotein-sorting protein